MEDILSWILTLIGLIGGIIAGFGINWFFHNKALKKAKEEACKEQQQSQRLKEDIFKLQTEIESLKAQLDSRLYELKQNVISQRREPSHQSKQNESSITDREFYDEARKCCDPDGTIPIARLRKHFEKKMTKEQIDDRIKQFVEEGKFTIDDNQKIRLI
jgi:uncharacterized protein (DUF3084 family)